MLGPITLEALEEKAIQEAMIRHAGRKPAAAEELGISLKTLYNKLNAIKDRESLRERLGWNETVAPFAEAG